LYSKDKIAALKKATFGTILCFRRFSEHSKSVKWVVELGLNYAKLTKKFFLIVKVASKIRTRDLQIMERRPYQ
jgi:hypothetical protein